MDKKDIYSEVEKVLKNYRMIPNESVNYFKSFLIFKNKLSSNHEFEMLREIIDQKIDELRAIDNEKAIILEKRYRKNKSAIEIGQELFLSKDQINRYKRDAITVIAELINKQEEIAREKYYQNILLQLPSLPKKIIGHSEIIEELILELKKNQEQEVFFITGIGGIGKSTITNLVLQKLIYVSHYYYDEIIWIRIPNDIEIDFDSINEYILQYINKDFIKCSIIVIDNIHTKDQFEIIKIVLEKIQFEQSKIIFTSRFRPLIQEKAKEIWISEITKDDFINLFIMTRNLSNQKSRLLDNEILNEIYTLIGGNPLAIKLFASLSRIYSLRVMLNEIDAISDIDTLYRYVFFKAWDSLSNSSRSCLLSLPIFLDVGVTIEQIVQISDLTNPQVIKAINKLYEVSLLELRGNFIEKKYGIHHLTYSFLKTTIIND